MRNQVQGLFTDNSNWEHWWLMGGRRFSVHEDELRNQIRNSLLPNVREIRTILADQMPISSAKQVIIDKTRILYEKILTGWGIPFRDNPVRLFRKSTLQRVKGEEVYTGRNGGYTLDSTSMIFLAAGIENKLVPEIYIHERLHDLGWVNSPFFSEGFVLFFTFMILMIGEGKSIDNPNDILEFARQTLPQEERETLLPEFEAMVLIAKAVGYEPLIEAYFKGDYSSLINKFGEDFWKKYIRAVWQLEDVWPAGFWQWGEDEPPTKDEITEGILRDLKTILEQREKSDSDRQGSSPVESDQPGGIDFNPNNLEMQTQGKGLDFNYPFNAGDLQNIRIDGFTPVIINVTPLTNLPLLLGLIDEDTDDSENIHYTSKFVPINHKEENYLEVSSLN